MLCDVRVMVRFLRRTTISIHAAPAPRERLGAARGCGSSMARTPRSRMSFRSLSIAPEMQFSPSFNEPLVHATAPTRLQSARFRSTHWAANGQNATAGLHTHAPQPTRHKGHPPTPCTTPNTGRSAPFPSFHSCPQFPVPLPLPQHASLSDFPFKVCNMHNNGSENNQENGAVCRAGCTARTCKCGGGESVRLCM